MKKRQKKYEKKKHLFECSSCETHRFRSRFFIRIAIIDVFSRTKTVSHFLYSLLPKKHINVIRIHSIDCVCVRNGLCMHTLRFDASYRKLKTRLAFSGIDKVNACVQTHQVCDRSTVSMQNI